MIDHGADLDWTPYKANNGADNEEIEKKIAAFDTPRKAGFKCNNKLIKEVVDPRLVCVLGCVYWLSNACTT